MAKQEPDIPLTFHRNSLSDMPERFDALASRQDDKKLAGQVAGCATTIRGILGGNANTFTITKPRRSWIWLKEAASKAGARTFAKLVELKLEQHDLAEENRAEQNGFLERTAAAMEEFKAGGGE